MYVIIKTRILLSLSSDKVTHWFPWINYVFTTFKEQVKTGSDPTRNIEKKRAKKVVQ